LSAGLGVAQSRANSPKSHFYVCYSTITHNITPVFNHIPAQTNRLVS
jgi:hypothetical protein